MTPSVGQPPMTLTFLELLDRTFRIYRNSFLTFVGLVALILIPLTIFQTIVNFSSPEIAAFVDNPNSAALLRDTDFGNRFVGAICAAYLILGATVLIQGVLIYGPVTYIASENHLGRRVSIREAFGAVRGRLVSLGCGYMALSILMVALSIPILFIASICPPVLAAFVIVVYVGVAAAAFAAPVLTLENVSTSLGVTRAYVLGKSRFWRLIGFLIVIYIVAFIIQLAFGTVSNLLVVQVIQPAGFVTAVIFGRILDTILSIFILPVIPIGLTVLYYDVRARVEGLDIALAALDKPDARPSDILSPQPGPLFTGRDWRNMGLLILVVMVIGAILVALGVGLVSLFAGLD